MNYKYITDENKQIIIDSVHRIHCNPELSHQEYQTTDFIASTLQALNIELTQMQPATGVIGLLKGGKPGPTIALRADIDALPLEENPEHAVRSQNPGVMHACGHDFHTAALLGAARALEAHRQNLNGNILFIFQPAEETTSGAAAIIETGVFKKYPPAAFLTLHVMPHIPTGKIGVRDGTIMAAQSFFRVDISGKGGHGAMPHATHDPLIAAVRTVDALQCIASRCAKATEPFVLSVCSLHSGTTSNIIPETAYLEGTYRYLNGIYEKKVPEKILQISTAAAEMHDCTAKVSFFGNTPFVVNDPELAIPARKAAANMYGEENLIVQDLLMGAEDFSVYGQIAPTFMYHVGVGAGDGATVGLHNPATCIPDEAAIMCAELFTLAAITVSSEY